MRRLPPLNALKAFEATARLSSVTAAAEELGVSHSAVSQQVRLLEDFFGQRLFTRPGRRVQPTPAALAFLEDVRAALDRLSVASAHFAQHGSRRVISLSTTPSFALRWLIPKTAQFQLEHPSIELRISTSVSDGIAHLDGPYDLIIRRDAMERPGHSCRRILDDVSTPALAPALFSAHAIGEPGDLLGIPLLHLRSRPDAWKRWFDANGIDAPEATGGTFFDHFFLSAQAAINGLGVAMMPEILMADDLHSGALIAPFPDRTLVGPGFHLLFRDELRSERPASIFLSWLAEQTGVDLDQDAPPAINRNTF